MSEQNKNSLKSLLKLIAFIIVLYVVYIYVRPALIRWATDEPLLPDPPEVTPEETAPLISAETIGKIMLIAEDCTYSKYAENKNLYTDTFIQVTGKIKLALLNEETGAELMFLTELEDPENLWAISYYPDSDAGYYYDKGETITAYGDHLDSIQYPDASETDAALLSFIAYHVERIALPDDSEVMP